jgi:hypothetical protein
MWLFRERGPSAGPRKSKAGGRLLRMAGPLTGLFLAVQVLREAPSVELGVVVAVFVLLAAYGCWHWGTLLSLPDAREVMRRDPRPPVIFLRSFLEDARQIQDAPVGERQGGTYATTHSFTAGREQAMAAALDQLGPFVAIGRPGEPLATLGASRVYLGNQDWKGFVEGLVPLAAAVVLQPEFTPGTLWEVGLVVKNVDLRRLLLVVPDPTVRPFRFERVRQLVSDMFDVPLPSAEHCPTCDAFYFDPARHPVPLRLESSEHMMTFVAHVRGLGAPKGQS